jgi:uncharacterized membrane protein YfcA
MLSSAPVAVIVGIVLGFLTGLGVGGGTLLILWLTLVLETDPEIARMINLMFFLAAAGAVSLRRLKKGTLRFRKILPAALAGCAAAAVASLLAQNMDVTLLKKAFGILLLVTGVRELLYRPRKLR